MVEQITEFVLGEDTGHTNHKRDLIVHSVLRTSKLNSQP